jgi:hypothetical protein
MNTHYVARKKDARTLRNEYVLTVAAVIGWIPVRLGLAMFESAVQQVHAEQVAVLLRLIGG